MSRECIYRTDFLFSSSDIITGFATILNLQGNFFDYNYSHSAEEADNRAIECDWALIAQDLKDALSKDKINLVQNTDIAAINENKKSTQLALFD